MSYNSWFEQKLVAEYRRNKMKHAEQQRFVGIVQRSIWQKHPFRVLSVLPRILRNWIRKIRSEALEETQKFQPKCSQHRKKIGAA